MHAFIDRILPVVRANSPGPAEVASARRRLHDALTRLGDFGPTGNRYWCQTKLREEQSRMLLLDYPGVLAAAAEILAAGVGVEPRVRVLIEADVLRVCLSTLPAAQVREGMEIVFARPCYDAGGAAHAVACLVRARFARLRGDLRRAAEEYRAAWTASRQGWVEPIGIQETLTGCAELAFVRGERAELTRWRDDLARANRGYPSDEFRLCFVDLLVRRLARYSEADDGDLARACSLALALLEGLAERACFIEHAQWLLYLLASAGAADQAAAWDHLLPPGGEFVRRLWQADLAWFHSFGENGLSAPRLWPWYAPASTEDFHGNVSVALRVRLAAGYQAVGAAAARDDQRLECRWRTELLAARLAHLGRHA